MKKRHRQILFLAAALISLVLLAAPARGADWLSFHVDSRGFGISFGSNDWWPYGASWDDPHLRLSFDAVLDGYGEWLWVDGLGRVWRPWVTAGWTPYRHGRWVITSAGWTWVSYEPWGYFPHHYGYWAYTFHGWAWVPGYTYLPANVGWVQWGNYVGWYPCPPAGWSNSERGIHQAYNSGYRNGYNDGWRDAYWATYVPWNRLNSQDVSRYATNSTLLRRTVTNSEPRISNAAPSRADVQRRGVEMAPTARLERRTATLAGRSVTVARPDGLAESVQQHARSTVERALPTEISRRVVDPSHSAESATGAGSVRSRRTLPAESNGRAAGTGAPPQTSVGAEHSSPSPRPLSNMTSPRDRNATDGTPSGLASGNRPRHEPASIVIPQAATSPGSGAVGGNRGSPQQRGRSQRADSPEGSPERRAPLTRSTASAAVSRVGRSEQATRNEATNGSEPENPRDVSRTRVKGTEKVKRR